MKTKLISGLLAVLLIVAPLSTRAQTSNVSAVFNTLSVNEKIAFLYGMIAQLQLLLEQRQDSDDNDDRDESRIDVETRSATNIEDDEAELNAEIDLNGEDEALVWFEYGEDRDLDERTGKERVTDSRGDRHSISEVIDDLDADETYYFRAVVEDEDGDRSYGRTRSFTTDDDGRGGSSSGDFELDVSETSVDAGDEVEVYWEIEDGEEGSQNWVGLYKVGADNRQYVKWVYIDNDTSGTEYFTIDTRGDFEFRLFLDNSYDDEATSPEVTAD